MLSQLRILALSLLVCSLAWAGSEPAPAMDAAAPVAGKPVIPWAEVLDRYFIASPGVQTRLRDCTMEVDISGSIPRLKKTGTLHTFRQVTRVGQIVNNAVRSAGDKMVVKDVIARYLTAETEASKGVPDNKGKTQSIAITPDNYKFKHKTVQMVGDRQIFVFQVTPKKKRVGLFKGEIWVDAETGLPVREAGRFVRNPSVFLKNVDFVREYELRDGFALPVRIESRVDTRLVGLAELDIRFSNFSVVQTAQSRISPLGW
jgi:hypothetical protein